MFTIKRYSAAEEKIWNDYVAASRNGTFLFNRGYMDYHSDRFCDHSLLFYKGKKLHSVMPAHERGDTFCTHRGLTFGGLIIDFHVVTTEVIQLFRELNTYLREHGFRHVFYKPVPSIYHLHPAEEDLYAIHWECKARITSRDIGTAMALQRDPKWRYTRRNCLKHALMAGITVEESTDFASFWKILEENLMSSHGVKPVHSLFEIELLHSRFPHNIRLLVARKNVEILAGMVLYVTEQVVHIQYISAAPEGKQQSALDVIYDYVMHKAFPDHRFLDIGRSSVGEGSVLNENLISNKEGFGGRGICYDTYEWDL